MRESIYSIYLVRCRDGSLYTGIATDVERRLREHADSRKGARYLRGKAPLTLVFQRQVGDRSLASKVEIQVKKLPKRDKSDLDVLAARVDDLLAGFEAANQEP
ncbi:MAG: GIY-YIG nuclease family protein [Gammaproteobacteria bacterium]|nr:GIY-YIG nuclease family protein [Gammaproteobacteria bacterium]